MSYFISAYASSPSLNGWEPRCESPYFQALVKHPDVIGIEHPFVPDDEKYPLSWLLEHIPRHWSVIITALPYFMNAMRDNPDFGLASKNEDARVQAISCMRQMSHYVDTLNNAFGRNLVKAVHFHSLPRSDEVLVRGSQEALQRSLDAIQNVNWQGATLHLEHCDAYVPGQRPDKGCLRLEEEINTLKTAGNYGLVLNWARSAIEGRSADYPWQHLSMAQQSGLLRGFFFSGCTDQVGSDYGLWRDTHMPPENFIQGKYLDNDSLLGVTAIQEILRALFVNDDKVYLGIKVRAMKGAGEVDRAVGMNLETLSAIQQVARSLHG